MRVDLGPVRGTSAVAWIRYGRSVVAHFELLDGGPVSSDVLARFGELLDGFERVADPNRTFHWTGEVDLEAVEFVIKGLYEIGLAVEAEHAAGRMELRPAEADEFHVTVVRQILAALELEGPATAQFVDGLRADWGVAGGES